MKTFFCSLFVIAMFLGMSAPAQAYTTSTFYGTSGDDEITVGRTYYGGWVYAVCINGMWGTGNVVTGSSDYVFVYGGDGDDYIKIQDTDDAYFVCGVESVVLYSMDAYYACPYIYADGQGHDDALVGGECTEVLVGNDGNDTLWGGDAYDWLFGGCDSDCLSDDDAGYYSCGECGTDNDKEDTPDSSSAGNCESSCAFCLYSP